MAKMREERVDKLGYAHSHEAAEFVSLTQVKDDPLWSSHLDEETGDVFYYNRVTRQSQWTKPKGFDGYDIAAGRPQKRDNEYTRTFADFRATPLEEEPIGDKGVVGEWTTVDAADDYFARNRVVEETEENNKQAEAEEEKDREERELKRKKKKEKGLSEWIKREKEAKEGEQVKD